MPDIEKVDQEKRRKAAFDKLPVKLRSLTTSIRNRLEKQNSGFIRTAYDIGEEIAEIQDSAGKSGVADPVGLMAVALSTDFDRQFLQRCARFYRLVPQETLDWLVDARSKTANRPITWTHIVALLSVDQASGSAAKFKQFAKTVFAEDLSAQELQTRLCNELREGEKNAGGRPIAIPIRLPAKLENIDKVLGTVVRNHHQIWNHADHGIEKAVADLPADQLNDDLLASIDRRRDLMRQTQVTVASDLEMLDRTYATVKQRLADKEAATDAAVDDLAPTAEESEEARLSARTGGADEEAKLAADVHAAGYAA